MAQADKLQDDGFYERLRTVLARVGELKRAAELTGFSPDQVAKWRDAKARPPFGPMAILSAAAGCSLDWLATGETSTPVSDEQAAGTPAPMPAETALLPLLNVVGSAGPGYANGDVEIVERLPFSRLLLRQLGVNPDKAQFITHSGDSMVPTLADGGVCLIDTARNRPSGDGIYALMVGDELLVKRLAFGAKGLTLISDNADKYPPETLTGDELGRVKIMGKVFWTGGGV